MRRAVGLLAAVSAAGWLAPAVALAYFDPGATIVSASPERREQADDSTVFATVSGDGGSVVFQTRARNLFADDDPDPAGQYRAGGIFERDLRTGALALVAHGDTRRESDGSLVTRGAQNPSVSADGRFVAFSTGEALVPEDVDGRVDAYVRDMSLPPSAGGAYDLVARKDGGTAPATYEQKTDPAPGIDPGSDVSPGAAISADGARVVFRTVETASDLPNRAIADTPGDQLLVRDRPARTTRLVTTVRGSDPPRPAGGAKGPSRISADGSTVVWPARNADVQTRFLPGESPSSDVDYYLWRRVDDGPGAAARRITGPADVDDPGCDRTAPFMPSQTATGPCYGPLNDDEAALGSISTTLPALSADGRRVAFVTAASPRPLRSGNLADLFVTDMSPGVSRKAGTLELTREVPGGGTAPSGPIQQVALSADGRRLAFTSFRTQFALPALKLAGAPRAAPTARELYLADLGDGTLERVVRAASGSDAGDDVGTIPSLSGDGRRVAFTSLASDLFFGDGNDRADAFYTDRKDAPPAEPPPPEPPADDAPVQVPDAAPRPARRLTVTARRASAGRVRLLVRSPVAGALSAQALGRLPDRRGRTRGGAKRLARASAKLRRPGSTVVTLRLTKSRLRLLAKVRRVRATATVRLRPGSGGDLTKRVAVVFRAPARPHKRRAHR